MYLMSHPPVTDRAYLQRQLFPSAQSDEGGVTSYYQLSSPYRVQIISFHPDDPAHYFLITSVDPSLFVYTVLKKKEMPDLLQGALHRHDYFELLFVLDGEVYQKIENSRHLYTAGSCCLLNKNVRHSEEYATDFRILFLQISTDVLMRIHQAFSMRFFDVEKRYRNTELEQFFRANLDGRGSQEKDYIDFIPQKENDWVVAHMHGLFDAMMHETLSPVPGSSHRVSTMLLDLMQLLSEKENYSTAPVRIGTDKEYELYSEITDYMEETHGRITRSALEDLLHYSGAHLNRITKKYTGLSISEYGVTFAMKHAATLLKDDTLSVQDIAELLGFSNRSHFYRLFEETYHTTPAAYRRAVRP